MVKQCKMFDRLGSDIFQKDGTKNFIRQQSELSFNGIHKS